MSTKMSAAQYNILMEIAPICQVFNHEAKELGYNDVHWAKGIYTYTPSQWRSINALRDKGYLEWRMNSNPMGLVATKKAFEELKGVKGYEKEVERQRGFLNKIIAERQEKQALKGAFEATIAANLEAGMSFTNGQLCHYITPLDFYMDTDHVIKVKSNIGIIHNVESHEVMTPQGKITLDEGMIVPYQCGGIRVVRDANGDIQYAICYDIINIALFRWDGILNKYTSTGDRAWDMTPARLRLLAIAQQYYDGNQFLFPDDWSN